MGLGLEALQPIASCFRAGVGSSLLCISKDSGRQKHITLQWKRLCKSLDETWQSSEPCWHQLKKHWCTVVKSCHLTCVLAGGTSHLAEASLGLCTFSGVSNGMHLCCVWQLSCIAGFPLHPCTVNLIFYYFVLLSYHSSGRAEEAALQAGEAAACLRATFRLRKKKPSSSTLYRLCYWNRCSRPAEGTRALRMLGYILGGLYNIFVCFCVGAWKSTWCT